MLTQAKTVSSGAAFESLFGGQFRGAARVRGERHAIYLIFETPHP